MVISGHARLAAAIAAGLKEVPTISHTHLNKNAQKAYVLAANKIQMKAGWDLNLLAEELKELKEENFDLSLTGFSEEELE